MHEGEVIIENNDAFGDGVNIAARIQSEAASGGICISDSVYRIIRNKEELSVKKIGRVALKNVKEPIVLYQLSSNGLSLRAKESFLKSQWFLVLLFSLIGLSIGILVADAYIKFKNPKKVRHYSINFPKNAEIDRPLYNSSKSTFTVSSDSEFLIYAGRTDNSSFLYRRSLNSQNCELIPGTENAENPFVSPNNKWIGFYAENAIRKIPVIGGRSTIICYSKESPNCTWLENDSIIFGGNQMEGLSIVHSSGGEVRSLTVLDLANEELGHYEPSVIPGTSKVLYSVQSVAEFLSINVLDLETGKDVVLIRGASNPQYSPEGYLLYDYQGSLYANTFDPDKNEVGENPMLIINNTLTNDLTHNIQYNISSSGTLYYMVYQGVLKGELVQIDMKGNLDPILVEDDIWVAGPKYSPDGKNLAFWMTKDEKTHVWIYNFSRQQLSRFTSEGTNAWPIWAPDGKKIAFASIRGKNPDLNIYTKAYGSNMPSQLLLESEVTQQPKAWNSNGDILLYHQHEEEGKGWGIYMLNSENMKSVPFLDGDYDERLPDFSPDNKWVVYESNETGILEVYVTDFPARSVKRQVSPSGGHEPLWSHKGDRIYYRNGSSFYVVQVAVEPDITFGEPQLIFSGNYRYIDAWGRNYDMSPDDSRIVAVRDVL
ncbi:MAG TPA: adenylate/guanylate cyclase domain-containing protein, partial [Desulfobacterales bacterium]|nr:adenylate/guanylate cyclase domain-containing protein [Desulfobacterales bacterium]